MKVFNMRSFKRWLIVPHNINNKQSQSYKLKPKMRRDIEKNSQTD